MSEAQRLGEILPDVMRDIQARMLAASDVYPCRISRNSNLLCKQDLRADFADRKSTASSILSNASLQNLFG